MTSLPDAHAKTTPAAVLHQADLNVVGAAIGVGQTAPARGAVARPVAQEVAARSVTAVAPLLRDRGAVSGTTVVHRT